MRLCMCEMALSNVLLTLLLLVTVTATAAIALCEPCQDTSDSPVITSTNLTEIVTNPGENYTITCEGHSPIIWKYPDTVDNHPRICETQKNGKYLSSIQLINISYINVGYYYCLLDNNSGKNSSLYLYVNDSENLLTYDDMAFAPVHAMQYDEIIIPCKPTHPEVNMTLCRNGEEKLHIGDNDHKGVIRYDPKVGFILENARLQYNGYYFCCSLPGGICSLECPRVYSVDVLKYADSVARPAINDTDLQHVKVGENVTMECVVSLPPSTKYILEWIIPNQSNRVTIKNISVEQPMEKGYRFSTGRRELKIVNVQLEDMGNYTCKVTDYAGNTNNETIYLKIFDRRDSIARPVIDEAHLKNVKVGENVTVECKVTVPSSLKCEVEWVIPNVSDRITVESAVIDAPVSPEHHLTTVRRKLKILNTKLEDTGNYTCKVLHHARVIMNSTIYLNIFRE